MGLAYKQRVRDYNEGYMWSKDVKGWRCNFRMWAMGVGFGVGCE